MSAAAIIVLLGGAPCWPLGPSTAIAGELEVSASTPTVPVLTRPAGRNFIELPSLDYLFAINAQCPAGAKRSAISISVADTRVSVAESDLAGEAPLNVMVTVPASQIGPIAVERFCTPDPAAGDGFNASLLTIPAVLSAQVSLLCAAESGGEMTYASRSLDVTLDCRIVPGEDAATPAE